MKSASKTKPVAEIPPFPEHARARLQAKVREVFGESTLGYKDTLEVLLNAARSALSRLVTMPQGELSAIAEAIARTGLCESDPETHEPEPDALELQLIETRTANGNQHQKILRLRSALQEVLAICEAGVIRRSETGKPMWSAFDTMKGIARAALAEVKEDA